MFAMKLVSCNRMMPQLIIEVDSLDMPVDCGQRGKYENGFDIYRLLLLYIPVSNVVIR